MDDLIDTGGTIVNASNALLNIGAKEVYACCTHGVLSGPAVERIKNSGILELVISDTKPLPKETHKSKIKILSVPDIFSTAYKNIKKK